MSTVEFAVSGQEIYDAMDFAQAGEEEISFGEVQPNYQSSRLSAAQDLTARIISNHDEKHTFSLVDNVIRVKTLNAQQRENKADFWKERRSEMQLLEGVGICAMISSVFLVATSWAAVGLFVGIFSVGVTALAFYRASQASKQIDRWSQDLAKVIAHQRTFAFEKGLLPIFKHDMKDKVEVVRYSSILTPVELLGLYGVYFSEITQEFHHVHQAKDQVALIEMLVEYSPLGRNMCNYSKLDAASWSRIAPYQNEFSRFITAYESIERRKNEHIRHVKDQAYRQLADIENQKEAALAELYNAYSSYEWQILEKRDATLAGLQNEKTEERAKIIDAARNEIKEVKQVLSAAKEKISAPFNFMQQKVKEEERRTLHEITKQRDLQILPFYGYLQSLHEQAYQAYMGQVILTQPQFTNPFNLSFTQPHFHIYTPVPPTYDEVFDSIRPNVNTLALDGIIQSLLHLRETQAL